MSDSYSELSKLLYSHKKIVGMILAEEDKKYRIKRINDQILLLQKTCEEIKSTETRPVKPMKKKKLQERLNWPNDQVVNVINDLNKHPELNKKKEKSPFTNRS